jgi:hypothetical protein
MYSTIMTNSIEDFVKKLCYTSDYYTNESAIIKELKFSNNISKEMVIQLINKFSYGLKNRCIVCGVDMGIHNPRQLCRKTYCDNDFMY